MMKAMTLAAVLTITATPALASLNVDVTPAQQGAWVEVDYNGEPVSGAAVKSSSLNESLLTSESGRVFIPTANNASSSITYTVNAKNTQVEETRFIAINRD
ncbi:hypothetical protein [Salinivibrio kushneri]|uniref:hypothetical protein n=1 Tax=Salinivibrio kushneri TaxID=1908198 RepID=UPI0009863678|nr:hypothetical protein [Salinivibrio kushneri]OOE51785.1 hypothetical protein BZG11_06025 [Salinivibrio kushneri]OOE54379.1 hypothetical protein BZG10_04365 [Salinivibrio kushneri]OOE62084.1 hypothetical protein BZG18_06095 [Salinivibrio kushneri]